MTQLERKFVQDAAQQLYARGLSTRQIADRIGRSKSWVFTNIPDTRGQSAAAILRQPAVSKHWRSSRAAARNVWRRAYGSIPEGMAVHHIDGDYTNNSPINLECLTAHEHGHLHRPANPIPRHLRPERQAYMKIYLKAYWQRRKENARDQ